MAKKKEEGEGKKKKPVVPIVLVFVGLLAGVFVAKTMLASPPPVVYNADGTPVTAPRTPGEIGAVDAMNINLAGGHYLRVAVGVQLEAGTLAEEWVKADGAKVNAAVIEVFSGQDMAELNTTEGREAAREELKTHLMMEGAENGTTTTTMKGAAPNPILDVYLTEFVTH